MGRRPKALEKHILEGTYRADRHGPLTPADMPAPPPPMPAKLTGSVAVVWGEVVEVLAGVVKARDVPTLVELCRWVGRADTIAGVLDGLEPGGKGYTSLITAAAIATDKVLLLSGRFGLSPADRAKLRSESAGPAKPKVASRPRTRLDRKGPPK